MLTLPFKSCTYRESCDKAHDHKCDENRAHSDLPIKIHLVYRIAIGIDENVGIPAPKPDGIFGGPAANLRVVVAGAEADQFGVPVVEAAGEPERLEAGIRVLEDG